MIKRTFISLAFFALLVGLCSHTYGQRKIISSREYFAAIYPSQGAKYYEKSRRVETTDEELSNGVVTKITFTVSEALPPDRTRIYIKITDNGKVTEFERIKIDYMQYTRENGGAWTKVDLRAGGLGTGSGSGSGTTRKCDQYSVEATFLNGRPVQLFEWLSVNGNTDELRFSEDRHWIDDQGLPNREELVSGKLYPREELRRMVITYEYDPKITIEAPIK